MPYKDLGLRREKMKGYKRKWRSKPENLAKDRARAVKREANRRKLAREFIQACKEVPCKDCGIEYPHYVMEFDHVGEKLFNVSNIQVVKCNLELLADEIAKCEVVCANCHKVRTWERSR